MTVWEQYVVFPYGLLLLANLLLIVICLLRGSRLRWLCRLAVWINAGALLVALIPWVVMACKIQTSAEARLALLAMGLVLLIPLALELLAFAAIYLWRMRPPANPGAAPR